MADAQFCQRVICGAVSQAEAGLQALWECSQAGYVGALPCSHPDCQPYLAELRSRGMCPAPYREPENVVEVLPLHPPVQPDQGELPLPPVERVFPTERAAPVERILPIDLVAPMPSIVVHSARPVPEAAVAGRGYYCEFMQWVSANQTLAAACVIGAWWILRGKGGGR